MSDDKTPKEFQSEESIIRGDSFNRIIDSANSELPVISEYQFKRDILDLLEYPFGEEFVRQYEPYVGDLTKPLQVVEDTNRDNILFSIPAIYQSPKPSAATNGGYDIGQVINSFKRERELGVKGVDSKIKSAIEQIVVLPDIEQEVLLPIARILKRYDRKLRSSPDGTEDEQVVRPNHSGSTSTFNDDDYE